MEHVRASPVTSRMVEYRYLLGHHCILALGKDVIQSSFFFLHSVSRLIYKKHSYLFQGKFRSFREGLRTVQKARLFRQPHRSCAMQIVRLHSGTSMLLPQSMGSCWNF